MTVGYIEVLDTPATRINFDAISKWDPARAPTKPFEMGDIDGNGVVETSGASILKMKMTIEIKSISGGKTALELWNDLDDLIADSNDEQMTLSITFDYSTPQTITFIGKATKGVTSGFIEGEPEDFLFSLGFSVETKGAII